MCEALPSVRVAGAFSIACTLVLWMVLAPLCVDGAPARTARTSALTGPLAEARTHWQKGRVDEALEAYAALAEKAVDPVEVALGRSRCYETLGDWKNATEV